MARNKFIQNSEYPYHITARAHNRDAYPLPLEKMWKIFCKQLWLTHMKYDLRIHSFVLMPNHFHMIARTPLANLDKAMNYFMSQSSKEVNLHAGRINQLHGGRHFKCLISNPHYATHAYKYVYRNPVKAKLYKHVEESPYSTLSMFLGQRPFQLPLEPDEMLMDDITGTLKWLNRKPIEKNWNLVRLGLRHPEFKLHKVDPVSRKICLLDKKKL